MFSDLFQPLLWSYPVLLSLAVSIFAFLDVDEAVDGNVRKFFDRAARPADFDGVNFRPLLQSEMQPCVVL
jgi:adenine-specific DNA glycosylase